MSIPTILVHQVGTKTVTYTDVGASTNGIAFIASEYPVKTVQAYGTFGGTVTIQGSNDPLGLTTPSSAVWFTLTTVDATTGITFTAAGMKKINENPRFVRAITGVGVTAATIVFECAEA